MSATSGAFQAALGGITRSISEYVVATAAASSSSTSSAGGILCLPGLGAKSSYDLDEYDSSEDSAYGVGAVGSNNVPRVIEVGTPPHSSRLFSLFPPDQISEHVSPPIIIMARSLFPRRALSVGCCSRLILWREPASERRDAVDRSLFSHRNGNNLGTQFRDNEIVVVLLGPLSGYDLLCEGATTPRGWRKGERPAADIRYPIHSSVLCQRNERMMMQMACLGP